MFIGIDLGTTYCCVAYKNSITNTLNVIDNPQKGGKSIPSVVSFSDDEIQYNLDAVNTKKNHPECVLYDAKRFIGRNFDNVNENFSLNKFNFTLINSNDKPAYCVKLKKKTLNLVPEQISGLILKYLKRIAEKIVDKVDGCVITVPAHFTTSEREATLFAAELAGLKVLQLLNEPSAAAISYGYEKSLQGNILVFDFGGGTLDVSIVSIENDSFDVVGYDGDQILGGRDIDNLLLEFCTEVFQKTLGVGHDSPKKRAILLEKCELAKILLSEVNKTKTEIFDWNESNSIVLTKQKFDELCKPFFERSIKTVERLLDNLKMKKTDIKEIIMTGGSSHIPLVQDMIRVFFGKNPRCHDPEAAVAKGAAIVAFDFKKHDINLNLLDQIRYSIGISINNLENKNGPTKFSIIAKAGTKIPCNITVDGFTTVEDNQTKVDIQVAEGESKYFKGNTFIDSFSLLDVPARKAGDVMVEITLHIDKSGILLMSARETVNNTTKSKEMRRDGNFYKQNEKENIKKAFVSIAH